jgi:phage terminase small subunit
MSLTPKQHVFIDGILSGLNQSDAYREAYQVDGMMPATIHNEAFKLMANPEIATSIEASRQHRRAWTLARILEEADKNLQGAQEDRQWASANGSLAFIAKASGVVQDRPTPESVSITKVTVVLDSGVQASLSEPSVTDFTSLEPGLEA